MHRLLATLVCAASIVMASKVQGQSEGSETDGTRRSYFGVWLGGESVPAGIDRACGTATGRQTLGLLGGFLVIPVGPIGIEGTVSRHVSPGGLCVEAGPLVQTGTHTSRFSSLPSGGFTSLDLRVRWTPQRDAPWIVSAGGGWAGSTKDVPYLVTSVGARSRVRSIILGVNLDVAAYHVPWTERTIQVATDGTTTQLSRRELKEWTPTVGLRFSVEIPVVPDPSE